MDCRRPALRDSLSLPGSPVDSTDGARWSNYTKSWSYATPTRTGSTEAQAGGGGGGSGITNLGKTLTRKVSSRWRRGGESVVCTSPGSPRLVATENTTSARHMDPICAAPSEAGSPHQAKGRLKKVGSRYSIRVSVDHKQSPSPLPRTPTPGTPTSFDSERLPRRLIKLRRSTSSAGPSPSPVSAPASTPPSGNKLWKLMKRISTGGLRDKYHSHSPSKSQSQAQAQLSNCSEESFSHASSPFTCDRDRDAPPPVPALPKDLQSLLPISSPTSDFGPQTPERRTHSDKRGTGKDRSASSPVSLPSSSPTPPQKKIFHRIRPISSVGILRGRSSTTVSNPASASASVFGFGFGSGYIPVPPHSHQSTRATTPSGQSKVFLPSRPETASSFSFGSTNPFARSYNESVLDGTCKSQSVRASTRSRRSSTSSLGDHHHHNDQFNQQQKHNQQQLNQQHNKHHRHQQQTISTNNKVNIATNGQVPAPPVPTNILAKHIVPPGELLKGEGVGVLVTTTTTVVVGEGAEKRKVPCPVVGTSASQGRSKDKDKDNNGGNRPTYSTHTKSLSKAKSSKVGLYIPLPGRAAGASSAPTFTSAPISSSLTPQTNKEGTIDSTNGHTRIPPSLPIPPRNPRRGGTNTSTKDNIEWCLGNMGIARSPDIELPSLPFPPRKRVMADKIERDGLDSQGKEKDKERVSGGWERGRSLTVTGYESAPPSPAPPSPLLSPSPFSSSPLTSPQSEPEMVEYLSSSQGPFLPVPALSTFGRVLGRQFGMERMEDPGTASVSVSPFFTTNTLAPTSGSASPSSLASTPGTDSRSGSRSDLTSGPNPHPRRIHSVSVSVTSRSGSISTKTGKSHYRPIPIPTRPRPMSRSYSSPVSTSVSGPEDMEGASAQSTPGQGQVALVQGQGMPGAFNTFLRKMSLSGGLSVVLAPGPGSPPPMRPARSPKRPSLSAIVRDGRENDKDKESEGGSGGKLLRKGSLKSATGEGPMPVMNVNGGAILENGDTTSNSLMEDEKQKSKREKWETLLEKSERAGGTLHLNADGEGLLSDKMSVRMSATSLTPSEEGLDGGKNQGDDINGH
ncbi:hypothetical protein AX15_001472 [Amanita polypyramis BW_CC]|nr:hypothetical protein AX15_001472 [Amanita polypyramis BW_CC]